MDEVMLNLTIFVSRSKVRIEVLNELSIGPNIATFLEKKINKNLSVISRALLELNEKKLVECLNPKDDRFRKYQITELGKKVLNEVNNS